MSTFFTGNLLDEFTLTKEKFETVVGLGSSKSEVRKMFALGLLAYYGEPFTDLNIEEVCSGTSGKHIDYLLDKWCRENYNNIPFDTVYHLVQSITLKKFEDAMLEIGVRGNPSAIAIMNEVIRKKENSSVSQIVFVNNLPLENEADKEDDLDD